MAITRAQQAKQMLQNGGRIGLKGGADAATKSFSESVGSTRESRPDPEGGFDLGRGQGPTFDGKPASTLTRSQIDKTREFKEAQKEKRKGLNTAEKFRVNRLKKS